MATKYAITYLNKDGMRQLLGPNQGYRFLDSPEAAESRLKTTLESNTEKLLSEVYGPQAIGTFEVRPVETYGEGNGDARAIYYPLTANDEEKVLAMRGEKIAQALGLKKKANGRYNMEGGDKTPLGLARTLLHMLDAEVKSE